MKKTGFRDIRETRFSFCVVACRDRVFGVRCALMPPRRERPDFIRELIALAIEFAAAPKPTYLLDVEFEIRRRFGGKRIYVRQRPRDPARFSEADLAALRAVLTAERERSPVERAIARFYERPPMSVPPLTAVPVRASASILAPRRNVPRADQRPSDGQDHRALLVVEQ